MERDLENIIRQAVADVKTAGTPSARPWSWPLPPHHLASIRKPKLQEF